ncbi:MAG: MlaA family lipoprotein [Gammaproteobacteria bacterium]
MRASILFNSLVTLLAALLLGGCAGNPKNPDDPFEGWNRGAQKFNDNLDEYVMKPVAKGYRWITPNFVDRGITNFFDNLGDIGVTINDFLQFKLVQGSSDAGRFLVNTIAGLGGLFDVATMIDLEKHDEDFDQTLGVWGVPMGPYIVLPFIGPSSPRGMGGLVGDALANPLTYTILLPSQAVYTAASAGLAVTDGIDTRADMLEAVDIASEAAIDRYDYFKNAYLQHREFLLYDGNVPEHNGQYELEEDFFEEDEDGSALEEIK